MKLTAEQFGGQQYYGCIDYLVVSYPQAVEGLHRSFLDVGVDAIKTDTFRANRLTLAEYGLQDQVMEINRTAASLARRLADEYSTTQQPRFVVGSLGPTGKLPSASDPDLSNISFDALSDVFREQAVGLIRGGVDVLLLETSQDLLELKAAILGLRLAFEDTGDYLPIQAQVTMDTYGRMLLGTDITSVLTTLEGLPIDVIGMNCSTGPEHMRISISFLGENASMPVSAVPNAGLPINVNGEAVYPLEPEPFAEALTEFVQKYSISVVGGCCGTTPVHLKLLVEQIHGYQSPARPVIIFPRLSSGIRAVNMRQEPPPFLIGERCNAQGSKKIKHLLLAEDYDGILGVAQEQVDNGAHALDISVAVTERLDEANLMHNVVRKLVTSGIDVPLVIDTTEPDVMEAALKTTPGRCLLNSVHLEAGRAKADRILLLAKRHNAAILLLTLDEQGMARSVERKVTIAKRLYDIAVNEYGLRPSDLVYDALTFTLATGDPAVADAANATIEAIRQIKVTLPGVFTSLGVSNVSFGLSKAARPVVNSVFLYHCVQAGLDMAIVNPAQITPYSDIPIIERHLVEDLIFNRHADALQAVIEYFDKILPVNEGESAVSPLIGKTAEERLHYRIISRHKENTEQDIDEIIARQEHSSQHDAAVYILNDVLLPAMKEVGDKFGSGELILPFVLQSAEAMKLAVSHLENYLERREGVSKGTLVLATVYGDVHDIGKNLVKTIVSNNGYAVIDLGKQVPYETIIAKAVEAKADAIGLSALLVSTCKQMSVIVNELARRKLKIPVLIGGAAINRRFGLRTLFTEDGEPYAPGVFYCKDAFEGLNTLGQLMNTEARVALQEKILIDAKEEISQDSLSETRPVDGFNNVPDTRQEKSRVDYSIIPTAPFWGPRTIHDIPLQDVFKYLLKKDLFRLSWGAKNKRGEAWKKLEAEFEERLARMEQETIKAGWLRPKAVYGFWPVQSDGDDLIILEPVSVNNGSPLPFVRFTFPRQKRGDHLCLTDYFASVNSDHMDIVAFQVVTVGDVATQRFNHLQESGDYSEAYYFHGLAVQTAEATAEYIHHHIRHELDIPSNRGKRYSWGYPAIPELADHRKVFNLLLAEKELSMNLTTAYQLIPEQSTAAIVVHHPEAKYFSV
ncbi:MAG: methionine synthase [Anaerolineales bacterium]|nr:methionine synthase [Anaerolineales bacterium]